MRKPYHITSRGGCYKVWYTTFGGRLLDYGWFPSVDAACRAIRQHVRTGYMY